MKKKIERMLFGGILAGFLSHTSLTAHAGQIWLQVIPGVNNTWHELSKLCPGSTPASLEQYNRFDGEVVADLNTDKHVLCNPTTRHVTQRVKPVVQSVVKQQMKQEVPSQTSQITSTGSAISINQKPVKEVKAKMYCGHGKNSDCEYRTGVRNVANLSHYGVRNNTDIISKDNVRLDVIETFGFHITKRFHEAYQAGDPHAITVATITFPPILGKELFILLENEKGETYALPRKTFHGRAIWPSGRMAFVQGLLRDTDGLNASCGLKMDMMVNARFEELSDARLFLFSTGGDFAYAMNGATISLKRKMTAKELYKKGANLKIKRNSSADLALLDQWVSPEYSVLYERADSHTSTYYPRYLEEAFMDVTGANPMYTFGQRVARRGGISVGLISLDPTSFVVGNLVGNALAGIRKPEIPFYEALPTAYAEAVAQCKAQSKT